MTKPYNPLQDIFRRAHFNARWKKAGADRRPYRVVFTEALKSAWKAFRQAQAAKRDWRIRQQLREEQNVSLPVRSCSADAPVVPFRTRYSFGGSRLQSAVGE